jgi:hypothetical protein
MKPFLLRAAVCAGVAISLSGCFYSESVTPPPPAQAYVVPPPPPSGTVVVHPTY